jgi:undecaprenyl-diphosphatase
VTTGASPSPLEAARGIARRQTLSTPVAVERAGTGLRVSMLGIVGFGVVYALVRDRRSEAFDLAMTMKLQSFRYPVLDRVMRAVSWPGFPPQSRLVPPMIVASLWLLRLRLEAAMQVAAWGTAALSTAIKLFMGRPRPVAGTDLRVVAAELGGSSFPSGHVLTYVGTYGWLAVVTDALLRPAWLRRLVVLLLGALVALVGPSRIYQGHHWTTDVAASYLLGSSYLALLVAIYRRLKGGARRA